MCVRDVSDKTGDIKGCFVIKYGMHYDTNGFKVEKIQRKNILQHEIWPVQNWWGEAHAFLVSRSY